MTPRRTLARWTRADGSLVDEEDRGLVHDVETLTRRRMLGLVGVLGAGTVLGGCGTSGSDSTAGTSSSSGSSATGSGSAAATAAATDGLTEVPQETAGPYPGDGSNGPDVLDDTGIVRRDIRSSLEGGTTAEGVPLTIRLTVRDAATGDARAGDAVYLWHCDRDGAYSLYGQGLEEVSYLRGVQAADASGTVTFTSIFPACYSGRWPHVHFEVYASLRNAVSDGPIVTTSQIALPRETCETVYAQDGYEQSVGNLARTSLGTDAVFGDDGGIHQVASMSGSVAQGYVASLTIGV